MKNIFISCFALFSFFYFPSAIAQSWQWGIGVTGGGTDGWAVATDPSGNVFCGAANFSGSVTVFGTLSVPGTGTGYQVDVAKYNPAGVFQWAVSTQGGAACLVNIAADKFGNLFVLGSINDPSTQIGSVTLTNSGYPSPSYFVAKFDPTGALLWAKSDGGNQGSFYSVYLMNGLTRICAAGAIAVDTNGAVYVASNYSGATTTVGTYTFTNAGGGGTDDIIVAKYSPTGALVWAASAGGNDEDAAYGITVTPAGNVYIAGAFASTSITFGPSAISSPAGNQIAFIAEYNSAGAPVWASGSGGTGGEYAAGLGSDANNNVYMTGGLLDNSIAFSGTTVTNPYPGQPVLYLIKFDPSNNVLWSKTIGSAVDSAWGYCVATSTCGEIWVSGAFTGNVSVDGNTIAIPAGSEQPVFIAGFNAAATYVGSASLTSGGDDQTGMACDGNGDIYLCADYGFTPGSFTVGPSTLADIVAAGAYEWLYLGKYTQTAIGPPDTTRVTKDTAICDTGTFVLQAPPGYIAYIWNDGSTGTSLNAHGVGTYWVLGEGTCSGSSIIETFNITAIKADTTYMSNDTSICSTNPAISVQLTAPSGHAAYLWSNGSTGNPLVVSATGTYWAIASGTCTMPAVVDTFKVSLLNLNLSFSLGNDITSCAPVELRVPVSGVSYLWQDGSTADTLIAAKTGTYSVTISKEGCKYADSINVNINSVTLNLKDTTFCREDFIKYTLYANAPQNANIKWSTGETAPQITVADTGIYWVAVVDSPCTTTDTAKVSSEWCDCELYLPNAFTPNGDGLNDYYYPIVPGGCSVSNYHFAIYNRWGERVFFSENQTDRWDGTYKGTYSELGVYMYYLEYTAGLHLKHHMLKGDVTLVR